MMEQQVDKWQNQLIQTDELLMENAQINARELAAYCQQAQLQVQKYQALEKMQTQLTEIAEKLQKAHDLTQNTAENLVEAEADLEVLQHNRLHHEEILGMKAQLVTQQQELAQVKQDTGKATQETDSLRARAADCEKEAGRLLAAAQRKLQEQQ